MRCLLLRLGQREHWLLVYQHHVISDAWSCKVLMHDMAVLYQAAVSRRASALPELPIQYVDFACWQREWLQGEVLEGQLAYWRRQLAEAPAVLDWPTDRP